MTNPLTVPRSLALNIRQLRELRGLTQEQLSRLSGVPRPTWANLESGAANPTLAVLVRVAEALQITVEELIGPPKAACQLYPADSLPVKKRGGVTLRGLLPDTIRSMEIDRMELPAQARMVGVPHRAGTREYLTCETGRIEVAVSGEIWALGPGDVLVFRGDQKHSYLNPGTGIAVGYSVVMISPS